MASCFLFPICCSWALDKTQGGESTVVNYHPLYISQPFILTYYAQCLITFDTSQPLTLSSRRGTSELHGCVYAYRNKYSKSYDIKLEQVLMSMLLQYILILCYVLLILLNIFMSQFTQYGNPAMSLCFRVANQAFYIPDFTNLSFFFTPVGMR